jgi:four helix bundle protein
MKDFRGPSVWEKAHAVTVGIYHATQSFPREETYGITSQMRRCSSSVAANIAEGCGRRGNAEFARFLAMAMGSASELEYFLLLSHDRGYLKSDDYSRLGEEVASMRRMLNGLISKIRHEHSL